MDNAIEKVQPQVVDGIEFYVSNDGSQVGMSQIGLARFCGVSEMAVRTLLTSKRLETNDSKKVASNLEGINGAKVVPSDVCIKAVEYYAFESKSKNEIALFSFRKFAAIGFNSWVKQITGFNSSVPDNNEILKLLREVMQELTEVKVLTEEYNNIRKVTVQTFPGLNEMMDGLKTPKPYLPPSTELLTLREWLELEKGIYNMSLGDKAKLGRMVSEMYQGLVKSRPRTKQIKVDGKWSQKGIAYHPEHFPILEAAYKQFIGEESPPM